MIPVFPNALENALRSARKLANCLEMPSFTEFANPYSDDALIKEIDVIFEKSLFPRYIIVNTSGPNPLGQKIMAAIHKDFPDYKSTLPFGENFPSESEICTTAMQQCKIETLIVLNAEMLNDKDKGWILAPHKCTADQPPVSIMLLSCLAPSRVFRGKFERGRARICEHKFIRSSLTRSDAAKCIRLNLENQMELSCATIENILKATSCTEQQYSITELLVRISKQKSALDDADVKESPN